MFAALHRDTKYKINQMKNSLNAQILILH